MIVTNPVITLTIRVKNMSTIIQPASIENLNDIKSILSDWLSPEEVEHYLDNIKQSIQQSPDSLKFDSHFIVAISDNMVIGIAGFRKLLPKLLKFSNTKNPAELSMLYVSNKHRGGKGIGTALLNEIIDLTKKRNYAELIIRSSIRFEKTGWGFYDQFSGLERVGQLLPPENKNISQIWAMEY